MHPFALAAIAFSITDERIHAAEQRAALSWALSQRRPIGLTGSVAAVLARVGVGFARLALRLDRRAAGPVIGSLPGQVPPS